jgi:hypothetical protein
VTGTCRELSKSDSHVRGVCMLVGNKRNSEDSYPYIGELRAIPCRIQRHSVPAVAHLFLLIPPRLPRRGCHGTRRRRRSRQRRRSCRRGSCFGTLPLAHLQTSAYVSIRQHTSAYVSIRQLLWDTPTCSPPSPDSNNSTSARPQTTSPPILRPVSRSRARASAPQHGYSAYLLYY